MAFMEWPNHPSVVAMYENIAICIAIMEEPEDGKFEGYGFHQTYVSPFAFLTGLEPPSHPALTKDNPNA